MIVVFAAPVPSDLRLDVSIARTSTKAPGEKLIENRGHQRQLLVLFLAAGGITTMTPMALTPYAEEMIFAGF